ncbi:TOMM precursor leader peptide-binding protein [Streptomyces sp. enrichment culture]|uniref:TOMM precursor leader peptide-binding protein n=1 Tax=Streptomyces sp. enrichment culture TaxID=1795815 RepID=UPI003F579C6E
MPATEATTESPVRAGPALTPSAHGVWLPPLAALTRASGATVSVNLGWDLDWEQGPVAAADGPHLSVRVYDDEVVVGPLWVPGTASGCAACAEVRERTVLDHPLVGDLTRAVRLPAAPAPLLPELLRTALEHLAERPLAPGEAYSVSVRGTRRHRIARSFHCPACGPAPEDLVSTDTPAPRPLRSRPAVPGDATRTAGSRLVEPGFLRDRLVDDRFGPVRAVLRESHAPFAMSMAVVADAPAMGHGRARTFAETEPVAVLEAYERLGGYPYDIPLVTRRSYREVADVAVDPGTLGRYTPEQLAHPTSRATPFTVDTPMDWAWGHDLTDGRPLLVPADHAFYQYEYAFRRDRRAARVAGAANRRHYFFDCSSGCAVGANYEEAALHSLFELAERDAFLTSWYRARPLPHIPVASLTDPTSRAMVELIRSRGFDVHLLVATRDIGLPVVWVIAVNEKNPFPATFSSAGSGAEPEAAIRGALREVAQLVTNPVDWTREQVERMAEDPWLVEELEDHVRFSSIPETRDRALAGLGGPAVTLEEAFPDWPGRLERAAGGDVRGTLEFVSSLFADAGLGRIVVVDQTSREHADAGIAVARAVVPGIVPMCFGHAQQRLDGLPRLRAALRGTDQEHRAIPYDPHPFP